MASERSTTRVNTRVVEMTTDAIATDMVLATRQEMMTIAKSLMMAKKATNLEGMTAGMATDQEKETSGMATAKAIVEEVIKDSRASDLSRDLKTQGRAS